MATHSGMLAWRIPWTEKPGGLQPMGSHTTEELTPSLSWKIHSKLQKKWLTNEP